MKKNLNDKVNAGLQRAKELGFESMIVMDHPDYYPKFGFKKSIDWGIKSPFEVSEKVFMALELSENALKNSSGVVDYPREFFN